MAETRVITDHQEIREWAAARMGAPAIRPEAPSIGNDDPFLMLVFDQQAYEDQDQGYDRPTDLGRPEIVEWDEWFAEFDKRGLALVVSAEIAGLRESFHEIIAR
jgi:hypothetical protein